MWPTGRLGADGAVRPLAATEVLFDTEPLRDTEETRAREDRENREILRSLSDMASVSRRTPNPLSVVGKFVRLTQKLTASSAKCVAHRRGVS